MKKLILILTINCCFVLYSCEQKPKVINPSLSIEKNSNTTGVFEKTDQKSQNENFSDQVKQIKVLETLPTEKYIYLRVNDGSEEFWVATGKQNIRVGEKYFFKDGLLKTNFESKEYNRVFDKVYLVSKLVAVDHSKNKPPNSSTVTSTKHANSISIKELISQADVLEGKEVQITGKCTKINPNIMGRNWIHLKDGTQDDYDLVLTSNQIIPQGHVVTIKGVLRRNLDFGAGYKYDILIEDAIMIRDQ